MDFFLSAPVPFNTHLIVFHIRNKYGFEWLIFSVTVKVLNTDISGSATVTVNLNHITSSHALQVFFVSDFFKKKVEPQEEAEIPHTTLQETPTNGNHYENPN